MKLKWMTILALGIMTLPSKGQDMGRFTTEQERVNYALGVSVARNFRRQGTEVSLAPLIEGIRDGFGTEKLRMSEPDLRQCLAQAQNQQRQKMASIRGRPLAEINKLRGDLFLADNKDKEGVVSLPDGLQYKILKAGNGPKPVDTNTVECAYRSTLLDGTEFVCSNPGEPGKFTVQGSDVAGWREALKLMPLGSKWRLYIPPNLAYGATGVGRDVGPNETIVSDLELLTIK
jgi:FKBP-type peptidyl-prolyl cis-trans isomerase